MSHLLKSQTFVVRLPFCALKDVRAVWSVLPVRRRGKEPPLPAREMMRTQDSIASRELRRRGRRA